MSEKGSSTFYVGTTEYHIGTYHQGLKRMYGERNSHSTLRVQSGSSHPAMTLSKLFI